MKPALQLTKKQARAVVLHQQGLAKLSSFGKGKNGALETIRRLGYLQLDTLAVVARAHHHTLWSRNSSYREEQLGALMREKKIFEYWSHAAAFLPMEDFRFSLPRKHEFLSGRSHWFQKDKRVMQYVLDRIKAEGPLQARDFETDRPRGSWFDWKPAKRALEQLFQDGTLMVSERRGFQKVYDLAERVLPPGTDTSLPSREELAAHLVQRFLNAHGIGGMNEIAYLRSGMGGAVKKALQQAVAAKTIVPVQIEGITETYFALPELAGRKIPVPRQVQILSPFDNAIIQRKRTGRFFDYDFMIECYLPEPKRKFGYFCLPILAGEHFVGRFDPKADRAAGVFHVKSLYIENKAIADEPFWEAFAQRLQEFAAFNGCTEIALAQKIKADQRKMLNRFL